MRTAARSFTVRVMDGLPPPVPWRSSREVSFRFEARIDDLTLTSMIADPLWRMRLSKYYFYIYIEWNLLTNLKHQKVRRFQKEIFLRRFPVSEIWFLFLSQFWSGDVQHFNSVSIMLTEHRKWTSFKTNYGIPIFKIGLWRIFKLCLRWLIFNYQILNQSILLLKIKCFII